MCPFACWFVLKQKGLGYSSLLYKPISSCMAWIHAARDFLPKHYAHSGALLPPPQHAKKDITLCSTSSRLLTGGWSTAGENVRASLSSVKLLSCVQGSLCAVPSRHLGIMKNYINRRGLCVHSMSLSAFPKIYWCDSWLAFSVLLMG